MHSRLSPSGAERWSHCSGSVSLEDRFPNDQGVEAQEGEAAHWAASKLLRGQTLQIGETAPNGIVVDEEIADGVQVYVEDVTRILSSRKPIVHKIETRVNVPSIHAECWGTPDCWAYVRQEVTVYLWDFKWGHGFVEVFENPQLITYAAGILDELLLGTPDCNLVLRIVQPRAFHPEGPVREWRTTAVELRDKIRHLNASAHEALGPNPRTVVGPHCKHCKARHACKALQAAALDASDLAFDAVPFELSGPMLGRELLYLTRAADLLAARIAGLESQAEASLRSGKSIPGWEFESLPGREIWTKPIEEIVVLGQLTGIDLLKPPSAITPKQARDAGVPENLVAINSARKPASLKLRPVNITQAKKAFGGKK